MRIGAPREGPDPEPRTPELTKGALWRREAVRRQGVGGHGDEAALRLSAMAPNECPSRRASPRRLRRTRDGRASSGGRPLPPLHETQVTRGPVEGLASHNGAPAARDGAGGISASCAAGAAEDLRGQDAGRLTRSGRADFTSPSPALGGPLGIGNVGGVLGQAVEMGRPARRAHHGVDQRRGSRAAPGDLGERRDWQDSFPFPTRGRTAASRGVARPGPASRRRLRSAATGTRHIP